MIQYIAHRINSLDELRKLPHKLGLEFDIRDSHNGNLRIVHDPFIDGEDFKRFISGYQHKTLIINVKSERIELKVLEYLQKFNITDYFFLDSSVPMMYLLSKQGITKQAVRFSEIEPIELALAMKGKADWVWVDCFTKLPIDNSSYQILKNEGFKLCLVSPELQGRPQDIKPYKEYLQSEGIVFDAICTKLHNIEIWNE
jgi:hypothetical protein